MKTHFTRRGAVIFAPAAFMMLALVLMTAPARAHVSLKNGNYFISYEDVAFTGGIGLKIERVYNSKTSFKGIFGWGWGNEFQDYLTPSAEGGVVVHEYGGGASNPFLPESNDLLINRKQTIENIIRAAREAKDVISAAEVAAMRRDLNEDDIKRDSQIKHYSNLGLLPKMQVPTGTRLISHDYGNQWITRVPEGYRRSYDNGRNEYFDNDGRLQRITDNNGNYVRFFRDPLGRIKSVTDNYNHRLTFTFNPRVLVERIEDESGRTITYQYNKSDELTRSQSASEKVTEYEYDQKGRHNLAKLRGSSGETVIEYYGADLYENVKSVKDEDGTLTAYEYKYNQPEAGDTWIAVKTSSSDGKVVGQNTYEYFTATNQLGIRYTGRMIQTIDEQKTDTEYNEIGLPLRITRDGATTIFKYDPAGRVIYKETSDEITELTYDLRVAKVNYVKRTPKGDAPNDTGTNGIPPGKPGSQWAKFEYDLKGNLLKAENSAGKIVQLAYDNLARIHAMSYDAVKRLEFEYNADGKTTEIRLYQEGKLAGKAMLTYDENGAVSNLTTDPPESSIQTETSYVFQQFSDIVKVAAVDLSF